MTDEQREWIDNATYEQLLHKHRHEPSGSQWFRGETGVYFESVLLEKRAQAGVDGHVAASKAVGWEQN